MNLGFLSSLHVLLCVISCAISPTPSQRLDISRVGTGSFLSGFMTPDTNTCTNICRKDETLRYLEANDNEICLLVFWLRYFQQPKIHQAIIFFAPFLPKKGAALAYQKLSNGRIKIL